LVKDESGNTSNSFNIITKAKPTSRDTEKKLSKFSKTSKPISRLSGLVMPSDEVKKKRRRRKQNTELMVDVNQNNLSIPMSDRVSLDEHDFDKASMLPIFETGED